MSGRFEINRLIPIDSLKSVTNMSSTKEMVAPPEWCTLVQISKKQQSEKLIKRQILTLVKRTMSNAMAQELSWVIRSNSLLSVLSLLAMALIFLKLVA